MPKCSRCKAGELKIHLPYARMGLCSSCFIDYFQRRVKRTVEKYKMFKPDEVVGVAVSGGKDSGALLHALSCVFPSLGLVALHVNLGIKGYSDHCQEKAEQLARSLEVELKVLRVQELGFTIDDFQRTHYKQKMCSVCGTVKRRAFDELALKNGLKILATGHNLDDLVGTMFGLLFSGSFNQLIRLKPVLPPRHPKQAVKVKPLFKSPELEDLMYCEFVGIPYRLKPCPYAAGAHSQESKEFISFMSKRNPSFKHQALSMFLKRLVPLLEPHLKQPELQECERCGMPSSSKVCAFCKRVDFISRHSRS